ncbi:N-acetylmuramoyl-L-alanine amidase [Sulfurovum lithotrophicum]|uniref:N-acetylmuramoyl-L-alanine amidase n=1 Tax=Sulfurovum lithotrophicum TaxID=206403 RepID=A0A7U4RQH6_9BACT|nr:peptidoglycan recognition family protein [Sulfurovum lithotrophicum]AKF24746.1 N-acetylmuramoyl-L-alanine amidase [Sulfurovum lithotrophicum]
MTKTILGALALLILALQPVQSDNFKCSTKPIQPPLHIIDKPIDFGKERVNMTKAYIRQHYGKKVKNITITPRIIVLHWTAEMDLKKSFNRLKPQRLLTDRKDIAKASALNVSAQFLVDRDGTIYRLMPENWMARHVIGLNYSSIGIENIGGKGNKAEDLTPAQLRSNIALVRYLKAKYPTIKYLIGHYEYRQMEHTSLWLEKDKGYRTVKNDPGRKFMSSVRKNVKDLHLKMPPRGR